MLYNLFEPSQRNSGLRLILPARSDEFAYNGSKLWNTATETLKIKNDLLTIKIGPYKAKLKTCLLNIQSKYGATEWHPYNFILSQ